MNGSLGLRRCRVYGLGLRRCRVKGLGFTAYRSRAAYAAPSFKKPRASDVHGTLSTCVAFVCVCVCVCHGVLELGLILIWCSSLM